MTLVFTRQNLPILDRSGATGDLHRGAYVLQESDDQPDVVLIGTGSEVSLAVAAAELLSKSGVSSRVVSMPSWELFDNQPAEYRAAVLGDEGMVRIAVEAGITIGWERYTGSNGRTIGMETFGASGPGEQVMKKFGFTAEHVAGETLRLLGRNDEADRIDPLWAS